MSIYDGKGLILWEDGLFVPGSDLLARVKWAFAQIRAAGGTILLNEAGRPFGVPSDQNVLYPWQTASGYSTVYYQWGRYKRGQTPSAANPALGPNASEHTQGIAIDCNAPSVFDATLRAKFFALVGLKQTISSESWHWAIRGPAQVDLSAFAGGNATPIDNSPASKVRVPTQEEVDEMSANRDAAIVRDYEKNRLAFIYPNGRAVGVPTSIDVDAAVEGFIQAYTLAPIDAAKSTTIDRYASQFNAAQWDAFWSVYPKDLVKF